jgi:hypothetical protein
MYPVRAETSTRIRRRWNQNGAWLDQNGYGTCVGNAFAHRRADGPLLVEGIDEAFAQKLYLEAALIFYGGNGDPDMQSGTSGLSACQALLKRGAINKFEWMTSPEALRYAILERGSVLVGTSWYSSMYDPAYDSLGHRYIRCRPESGSVGGHEYLINGIDLQPLDGSDPYYRMKNSWGRNWGANGTARFHLEDLEELVFTGWGDAVLIHELPRAA